MKKIIVLAGILAGFGASAAGAVEVTGNVRQDCAGVPNCYNSLAAWAARYGGVDFGTCTVGNLVCANQSAAAQIDGTWVGPDTSPVLLNDAWKTDPGHAIRIFTTPAARHKGTPGTGYRLVTPYNSAITLNPGFVTIDGLSFQADGAGVELSYLPEGSTVTVSNNVFFSNYQYGASYGIKPGLGGDTKARCAYIWNNVFISTLGADFTGVAVGVGPHHLYNNTFVNSRYGVNAGSGTTEAVNNLAYGNAVDYAGLFTPASTNNLSQDQTAPGFGTFFRGAAVAFVNPAQNDYHLAAADSGARGNGVALSQYFATDIDGQTRTVPWDIGADAYGAVAPNPAPPAPSSAPVAAAAATYYISPDGSDPSGDGSLANPWKTNAKAFSAGAPGSTFIYLDGDYNYAGMNFDGSIPSGSGPDGATVLKAQNDGKAVISLNGALAMKDNALPLQQYIRFEGLEFRGPYQKVIYGQNLKFQRCGFQGGPSLGNTASVAVGSNNNGSNWSRSILIEDCWFWGQGGRYNLLVFNTENVALRRLVLRHDGGWSYAGDGIAHGSPEAALAWYNSSNGAIQDILVVDNNGTYSPDWTQAFYFIHNPSANPDHPSNGVAMRGIMVLNSKNVLFRADAVNSSGNAMTDALFVDGENGCASWGGNNNTAFTLNRIGCLNRNVIPAGDFKGGFGYWGAGGAIAATNLIVAGMTGGSDFAGVNASYFDTFNNGGSFNGTGKQTVDPLANGWKYPVRVESGSALANTGSGGPLGPNIVNRWGAPGSLYGEPGYDSDSGQALWPWPNQDRIKTDLCAQETRGFCSDASLTHYVMNYFGNGDPYSGTVAPVATSTAPQSGGSGSSNVATSSAAVGQSTNSAVNVPLQVSTYSVTEASDGAAFVAWDPRTPAGLSSKPLPPTMVARAGYLLELAFQNRGDKVWSREGGYALVGGGNGPWKGLRVALDPGTRVRSGDVDLFRVKVTAPALPGQYVMNWSVVRDTLPLGAPSPDAAVAVIASQDAGAARLPLIRKTSLALAPNRNEGVHLVIRGDNIRPGALLLYDGAVSGEIPLTAAGNILMADLSAATRFQSPRPGSDSGDAGLPVGTYTISVQNPDGSLSPAVELSIQDAASQGPLSLANVFLSPSPLRPGKTPVFHWSAAGNADTFNIRVYDAAGDRVYESKVQTDGNLIGLGGASDMEYSAPDLSLAGGLYYYVVEEVGSGQQKSSAKGKFAVIR